MKTRRGYTFFLTHEDIRLIQSALKSYKPRTDAEADTRATLIREIKNEKEN